MDVQGLADVLRTLGVEVRGVLNQTTHRPGVQPNVVTPRGLELGGGLCLYQFDREGSMWLYEWVPFGDDTNEDGGDWQEVGEFEPTEVDELIEAAREKMPPGVVE
jgi:hypothetical protein